MNDNTVKKLDHLENDLNTLDIPEKSKDVYKDFIILGMSAREVSNKYGLSIEEVQLMVNSVSAAVYQEEEKKMKPLSIPEDEV